MSHNTNQIIKQKLKQKERYRVIKRVLSFFHISIRNAFVFGVPSVTLFFTTFLAWQVSSFDYDTLKTAKAGQNSSVLGVTALPTKNIPDSHNLEIELIKQIYPLSCEAASLEMTLKYFGIEATQDQLLEKIGYSTPKELTQQNGKYYWGDPDMGFVGDPKGWFYNTQNGTQSLKYATGWGAHNGPVLKAAKQYRPKSYLVDNANIEQLKLAISSDNPVIWWHRRDDIHEEKIEITTSSGKVIDYQQMHVAVVSGYQQKQDITWYQIKDPYFGEYEIAETDFLRLWQRHSNQMVVVV